MTSSKVDHLDNDEVNQAAYGFKKSLELARSMISHKAVGRKGMARVLNAVIEFPLADGDPKFTTDEEEKLFILTLNAMRDKTTMMNAILQHQAQKAQEQETSGDNQEATIEEAGLHQAAQPGTSNGAETIES